MYTSKQAYKQKMFIVQNDEKTAENEVWIGENGHFGKLETRGCVCIELLNDTPGFVDKHQA